MSQRQKTAPGRRRELTIPEAVRSLRAALTRAGFPRSAYAIVVELRRDGTVGRLRVEPGPTDGRVH